MKPVHKARLINSEGGVSPVCADKPRAINLARATWTDTQRLEWLGEYCDRHEYVKPSHVIIDCIGQRTVKASFRDAVDTAAAKLKEANGE